LPSSNPRFTIRQKGLLLVGVPIVFQLVFAALFLRVQRDAAQAEHWALHTKDVIAQAETAYRSVLEAFSDTRGAVLLGHAPVGQSPAEIGPTLEALEWLVSDSPQQVQRVRDFRARAGELLAWMKRVDDLLDKGRRDDATALIEDPASIAHLRDLRRQLDTFMETEQSLNTRRSTQVARVGEQMRWLVGVSLVLGLLVAAALLWAFSQSIASRMSALSANAHALGERRPLGPGISGSDEIADVDAAFRAAAERLEELNATDQRQRDELEQRAAELARVNHDLGAKTQENETFVYSVSHDLRSPLVNLQGFSRELSHACDDLKRLATTAEGIPDNLRRQIVSVLDGDVRESVDFIQTAVTRSANIIDALLRLSRAGRVEYNWATVPVRPIVQRIVQAMQSTIRQHGAEVVVADELPDAFGDPTAIEQILGNLIGNAVNYLDPRRPGRIEIGTVPADSTATEGSTPEHPLRTYYVRDNGVGIPAAYVSKVFVAFQRLHGQMAPGEGIGLALVRRMVDRHGGKVWVESAEGQGSTFYVALPAPPPPAPPADGPTAPATETATAGV
jgi:signal transduction histidine kinase